MSHRIRILTSTALFALAALPAFAADYDSPLYERLVYDEAAEVPVEVGTGWYLRGDIGYAFSTRPAGTFSYRTFDPGTQTYGNANFATQALKGDLNFGVGFGYRFNDWMRADLTAERFQMRFNGTTTDAAPCTGQPVDTTCRTEDAASLNGTALMANAYVDLGTFAGFTPYIGGGAGFTIAGWNALNSTQHCVPGPGACGAPLPALEPSAGISSWRFTYAAMAGVAYDVSDNLKIDLGYKYRKVAGGDMFGFRQSESNNGATGPKGRDPGFGQHEIRVGLRYALW